MAATQQQSQAGKDGSYTFAAAPRAVSNRRRGREPLELLSACSQTANIMFDRRVVRGNTYAAQVVPLINPLEQTETQPAKVKRRVSKTRIKPSTPDPVDGRRHMDVQTDVYLEELTDKVPEMTVDTQTDPFLDRPMTPEYVPQKSGVDAETQIEEGDLFNFDMEVEPILEVLVGKTLEQSLMEVMEEAELTAMRAHQEHFEAVRNAELVATQRMEAAEQRRLAEKERRLAQERQRVQQHKQVKEKVAAQAFARGYVGGLVSSVFDTLRQAGVFFDPVEREVKEQFMPFLYAGVGQELQLTRRARATIWSVVQAAVERYTERQSHADERRRKEREEEARRLAEEEARAQREAEEKARKENEKASRVMQVLAELGYLQEDTREEAAKELQEETGSVPGELALLDRLIAKEVVTEENVQEARAKTQPEAT